MKVTPTALPEVVLIEPRVFRDDRGFFFESFNEHLFEQAVGGPVRFVQDNHSHSTRDVLRGLHYQVERTQGKLVRVVNGAIFDVAVDLRRSSPRFGRWVGYTLSAANHHQLFVPEGFAHGFLVVSESADVLYKTTDYWAPGAERCILWDDPSLAIPWPTGGSAPILSAKDREGVALADADVFA